jgi:hypothetical protein
MPDATSPLASEDPPTPAPDADGGPPRRGVTLLQKILIGVGLATVVIVGATLTALNAPGAHSDADACTEAMPLIGALADTGTVTAPLNDLVANLGHFEAAQRRAVPDGQVALVLARAVATMHDYQRTNDEALHFKLILDLTSVTEACHGVK